MRHPMSNRLERQERAIRRALAMCSLYGVGKDHIMPLVRKEQSGRRYLFGKRYMNSLVGYYVIDEMWTTVIVTIMI